MVDLQTIISEAGANGISLAKLKATLKLKDADLEDQLKHLRSQLLIAGPFKYGRGSLFYGKGYEPGGDSVAKMIEASIRNSGSRLPTAKQVEKEIKQPFKKFFEDGVRAAVATGRVAKLKGGPSFYLLHVDVVRELFPEIGSSTERIKDDKPSPSFKEQVLSANRALKAEQGGLGAVSIRRLLGRVGCSKEALHSFLLEEARAGNADLHPTTLVDLNPEDREGALPIPGRTEPAITVTLR